MFLQNSSYKSGGPILVIIGFGMGVWIGGLITYKAFELTSRRGYNLSIITPGINKPEIFHALRILAPNFSETILVGYPPFVKDVIDDAESRGINFRKINLRILNAAESYTEKFRDYLVRKARIKNTYLDVLNIYGTADLGAMAFETPITICINRLLLKTPGAFNNVFSQISKIPTVAQYNPLFASFEEKDGEILLTGDNSIPLVRYLVGDNGGVLSFLELNDRLRQSRLELPSELKKTNLNYFSNQLPIVFVYERADLSIKLYGAIIYPEHIREALQGVIFEPFLTGKFTALTKYNKRQDQFMEINIELKPNIKSTKSLQKLCRDAIMNNLLEKNAEYRNNYSSIPSEVTPRIVFWPYEHNLYFKPGIKQKWVKVTTA